MVLSFEFDDSTHSKIHKTISLALIQENWYSSGNKLLDAKWVEDV